MHHRMGLVHVHMYCGRGLDGGSRFLLVLFREYRVVSLLDSTFWTVDNCDTHFYWSKALALISTVSDRVCCLVSVRVWNLIRMIHCVLLCHRGLVRIRSTYALPARHALTLAFVSAGFIIIMLIIIIVISIALNKFWYNTNILNYHMNFWDRFLLPHFYHDIVRPLISVLRSNRLSWSQFFPYRWLIKEGILQLDCEK